MTEPSNSRLPLRIRVTTNFFPRSPWRYWRPRRITASYRKPHHVYRWLIFNIAPRGWPR